MSKSRHMRKSLAKSRIRKNAERRHQALATQRRIQATIIHQKQHSDGHRKSQTFIIRQNSSDEFIETKDSLKTKRKKRKTKFFRKRKDSTKIHERVVLPKKSKISTIAKIINQETMSSSPSSFTKNKENTGNNS